MNYQLYHLRQSLLSRRILTYVVICALIFTVISTVIQMTISYRRNLAVIETTFGYIKDSHVESIAASVFALDEEQIRLQLKGVLNFPNIHYVRVAEKRGDQQFQFEEGNGGASRDIIRSFPLFFSTPARQNASYGDLTVVANLNNLYDRMWENGVIAFSANVVGIGFVSFCIFLIFQFSVTRHLTSMCEHTDKLSLNQLDRDFELDRRPPKFWREDELHQLATAINKMRIRLKQDLKDLSLREEELRANAESLRRYEHIISSTDDLMSFVDRNYRHQAVNNAYLTAHAKQKEEIVGSSVEQLIGTDNFQSIVKGHLDRVLGGERIQYQSWFEFAGIGHRFMDVIYHPFQDDNDEISGVVVSVRDLTERKRAEESLRAIEWLLAGSVKTSTHPPQPYKDPIQLNTNRLILDSVGKEVLDDIVNGYLELLETSAAVYERNGDYAHGMFSSGWCQMMDSASWALCDTDDVSEALASGQWLCHESCWTNASKMAIQTGKAVDIPCHGGLRLYAVPIRANNHVVGSINFGYGDPPKNESELKALSQKYNIDTENLALQARSYESRPLFIIEIAKRRLESSAKFIGALIESKLSQDELDKEREKLRVTLKSIGDGVITTDTDGNIKLMNKMAESLTGWRQDEATGRSLNEAFHIINRQTRQRCQSPVEKVLKSNGIVELANDTVLVARDGTQRAIADSGSPIIDNNGDTVGVVLVFRDDTEKKNLENELRQAHKMEAIGNLAGGVAHEFNNVLGIIIGNTELAIDNIEKWHPVYHNLNEIKVAGLRASDVVKQLLSFSRKSEIKREPIDMPVIVKETLKLLRASLPSSIRMIEVWPKKVNTVVADPTQIHQLLINLCNNSADAIGNNGGNLTVEISNVSLGYEEASMHADLKTGDYVKMSVSDTGYGISPEILDKIFNPYFTTKDVSQGTGMGLAIVHGIVKNHDGVITVDGNPGRGASFHIFLPASDKTVYKHARDAKMLPSGTEKILFVDDEASIVQMCETMLTKIGYQVSGETDPIRVLESFRSNPNAYDLVISDMTMPNITGDRLANELIALRDDIPIIICTGYSEKIDQKRAKGIGIKGLLTKPVILSQLAQLVRKVLDAAKGSTTA